MCPAALDETSRVLFGKDVKDVFMGWVVCLEALGACKSARVKT